MAALNTCFASISDFSSPVSISTLAKNVLVASPETAGGRQCAETLPARILLQLFIPHGHLFAKEACTPPRMLAGYCAAQFKHLHVSLVTFNHWNHPLHGSDLGKPKQCFKETWRAPGLGSISITQAASGHAVPELGTALDSYAPHR